MQTSIEKLCRISIFGAVLTVTNGFPAAYAENCNISNLLFGKIRIDETRNSHTSIIIGNDFDSSRFAYGKILGVIAGSERDGSKRISDVNLNVCGILESNMKVDTSEAECKDCARFPVSIKRVGPGYVVINGSGIVGSIEGKLPQ